MWTLFSRVRKTNPVAEPASATHLSMIEPLEQRKLLSAAVSSVLSPDFVRADVGTSATTDASTTIQGYTPAQVKTAYGLTGLSFSGVSGDGSGQTIALVDAYNDPNISADLAVFDTQFGLSAPPSLKVVNQTGGSKLPADNADWDSEISLDVEWAHAIAPGANILLVEASSDDTTDLIAAVNQARSSPGVSTVSMSWGGSEFFDFNGGGESASETNYDTDFTTPAGHQGVTFIAAAGDSGSQDGVEWPAVSPNVISVGGTSLYTNSDGTYAGEDGWSGTSGGFSVVEPRPAYQDVVQTDEFRSSPDVAYDGDPNTGFAVYDSVTDDGYSGWEEVGGTSAGAPQWAAIVAIADQGRVLSGKTTLDGATQTLPTLYSLYTTTNNDYADDFNDVTSGGGGGAHFRWGGYGDPTAEASVGYDTVTGLGSPQGASLISALAGSSVTSTSGSTGNSGSGSSSGSGTSTTQTLPVSQVDVTLLSDPALSAVAGSSASATLRLTNTENVNFSGPVNITLYASTDGTVSSSAIQLTQTSVAKLGIKGFGSKLLKVKFTYPSDAAAGSYFLVASFTATNAGTAASVGQSATTVALAAPFADLAVSFADGSPLVLKDSGSDSTIVEITNLGNVTATGTFALELDASDGLTTQELTTFSSKKITLKAGKSTKVKLRFAAPVGESELIATITPTVSPTDTTSSDDQAIADLFLT